MDETVKQKLNECLASGKSYQEAVALLTSQGFTSLQIEDAKIALNSTASAVGDSKIDISVHPELAAELLKATTQMTESKVSNPTETNAMFTTGVDGTVYHSRARGNIYVLFIGMLVILIAIFVVVKYVIK